MVNHCSGSVASSDVFKTTPSVRSGSEIPVNPTGVSLCYLTDMARYFIDKTLTEMAVMLPGFVMLCVFTSHLLGGRALMSAPVESRPRYGDWEWTQV